jgi:hypothetical protein
MRPAKSPARGKYAVMSEAAGLTGLSNRSAGHPPKRRVIARSAAAMSVHAFVGGCMVAARNPRHFQLLTPSAP